MTCLKTYDDLSGGAPSKTFFLDGDEIVGTCDGKTAVKQACELSLLTERFFYSIFSGEYGLAIDELWGKSKKSVLMEAEDRKCNDLEKEDRVT